MNRRTVFLLLLWACSIGHGTTLVALADDANEPPCEQVLYTAPAWADPNLIEGVALPPACDAVNGAPVWTAPTGKFFRQGPA